MGNGNSIALCSRSKFCGYFLFVWETLQENSLDGRAGLHHKEWSRLSWIYEPAPGGLRGSYSYIAEMHLAPSFWNYSCHSLVRGGADYSENGTLSMVDSLTFLTQTHREWILCMFYILSIAVKVIEKQTSSLSKPRNLYISGSPL